MIQVNQPHESVQSAPGVTIASWSVLAQRHTKPYEMYCPAQYLALASRRYHIASVIAQLDADILCLQDVDHEVWNTLYLDLQQMGYCHESNRLPKMSQRENEVGVVMAWRTANVRLEKPLQPVALNAQGAPHVAIIGCFHAIQFGVSIVVASAQLPTHPLKDQLRLQQLSQLIAACRATYPDTIPNIVIAGTLGFTPKSGLLAKLKKGDGLPELGPLKEVYSDYPSKAFEGNEWTCFSPFCQRQIDYLVHNHTITPTRVLRIPDDSNVAKQHTEDCKPLQLSFAAEMIPCPTFPSTHIPLVATFYPTAYIRPSAPAQPAFAPGFAQLPAPNPYPWQNRAPGGLPMVQAANAALNLYAGVDWTNMIHPFLPQQQSVLENARSLLPTLAIDGFHCMSQLKEYHKSRLDTVLRYYLVLIGIVTDVRMKQVLTTDNSRMAITLNSTSDDARKVLTRVIQFMIEAGYPPTLLRSLHNAIESFCLSAPLEASGVPQQLAAARAHWKQQFVAVPPA